MAGEPNEPAETPAEVVNDGIIDLDAPATAETEQADGEETEGKTTEGEPKDAGDKPPGDDGKPPKLSGAQRQKIREAHLLRELSERDRKIEELSRNTPAATAGDADDKPPREEDFNGDWFAFNTAKTAYEAGKAAAAAVDKRLGAREQSERETKQAEIVRERSIAHSERVEDARGVIADFDQVMKTMDGVKVRTDVIEEIMSSDNSAVLAYHLAKNPDKLNAMNQMSGRELAREMGRLEATVKLPEAKKQTSAPAPLSTVKGGASPSSAEGDLAKWMAKTYGTRA